MKLSKILKIILVVWLVITILGGITLRTSLPGRSHSSLKSTEETEENDVRIAIFADPHITNDQQETQTDLGAPSKEISFDAKYALNHIKADYIFGLGDLTAHTQTGEWIGYKKWIENLNAPVYDFLGNHDRDHHPGVGSYGTEYFTKLGRVSATKVLKLGNNIFILVSEDHNPEGDGNNLASIIPDKRFEFIEKYLEKYSDSNNIFIMSHVQMSGTTAYSKTWFLGDNPHWKKVTQTYMTLFEKYGVDAHLSGHIHSDYRWKDTPTDQDLSFGVEQVEKFVSGEKINKTKRKYPPSKLPETYFLNMPVIDYAHGYIGSRLGVLQYYFFNKLNPASSNEEAQKSWIQRENRGPPLMDILHSPKSSFFTGRGAVYYFEMENNSKNIQMITRWSGGNIDVENFKIILDHPIEIGDGEMQFIASDLSLRKKENLEITHDNWFKIKPGKKGTGTFSKKYRKKTSIENIEIEAYNLKNYSVQWKGSKNHGENWSQTWLSSPSDLGKVNAIKIRIEFESNAQNTAYIEDIELNAHN